MQPVEQTVATVDPVSNLRAGGDLVSFRSKAVETLEGVQKTKWFEGQDNRTKGVVTTAIQLLRITSITDEQVINIVKGAVVCGLVSLLVYTACKPYAVGEHAPFRHDIQLVEKLLTDLKENIKPRVKEMDEQLKAVSARPRDNWGEYKAKLKLLEMDFQEYFVLIQNARRRLDSLERSFYSRDENYRRECKHTKSAWTKLFVLGEALSLAVTGGLWKGDFIDGKSGIALGVGSTVAIGGYTLWGYYGDTDIGRELVRLKRDLEYYEIYDDIYKKRIDTYRTHEQEMSPQEALNFLQEFARSAAQVSED